MDRKLAVFALVVYAYAPHSALCTPPSLLALYMDGNRIRTLPLAMLLILENRCGSTLFHADFADNPILSHPDAGSAAGASTVDMGPVSLMELCARALARPQAAGQAQLQPKRQKTQCEGAPHPLVALSLPTELMQAARLCLRCGGVFVSCSHTDTTMHAVRSIGGGAGWAGSRAGQELVRQLPFSQPVCSAHCALPTKHASAEEVEGGDGGLHLKLSSWLVSQRISRDAGFLRAE